MLICLHAYIKQQYVYMSKHNNDNIVNNYNNNNNNNIHDDNSGGLQTPGPLPEVCSYYFISLLCL